MVLTVVIPIRDVRLEVGLRGLLASRPENSVRETVEMRNNIECRGVLVGLHLVAPVVILDAWLTLRFNLTRCSPQEGAIRTLAVVLSSHSHRPEMQCHVALKVRHKCAVEDVAPVIPSSQDALLLEARQDSDFELFDRHSREAIAHVKQRLREAYPMDFQVVSSLCRKHTPPGAGLPYPILRHTTSVSIFALDHTSTKLANALNRARHVQRGVAAPARALVRQDHCADGYHPHIPRPTFDPGWGQEASVFLSIEAVYCCKDRTTLRDEILNIRVAGRDTAIRPPTDRYTAHEYSLILPCTSDGKTFYLPAHHNRFTNINDAAAQWDSDCFIDERLHNYRPRICLGPQFAYHEASFLVHRFQKFSDEIAFASGASRSRFVQPAPEVDEVLTADGEKSCFTASRFGIWRFQGHLLFDRNNGKKKIARSVRLPFLASTKRALPTKKKIDTRSPMHRWGVEPRLFVAGTRPPAATASYQECERRVPRRNSSEFGDVGDDAQCVGSKAWG
ncbi:hypothetical protein B0H11DRAFT_1919061 [Mycena galericulata]|nr:hypothetical protein B0H11DRAFT_1919061 [Mycena galericulata]